MRRRKRMGAGDYRNKINDWRVALADLFVGLWEHKQHGDGLLSDCRRCCQWTGTKQPPFNASLNPRHIVDYWGMSNGNTRSKPTDDRRRSVGVAIIWT